ncbi:unnamed protein product, partial [Brachionus calyciflorus]
LIPNFKNCPKCTQPMKFIKRDDSIDGFAWRCTTDSKRYRPIKPSNPVKVVESNLPVSQRTLARTFLQESAEVSFESTENVAEVISKAKSKTAQTPKKTR